MTLARRQDRRVPRGRQFGTGLLDLGFAPERVAKILGKEAKHIKERAGVGSATQGSPERPSLSSRVRAQR